LTVTTKTGKIPLNGERRHVQELRIARSKAGMTLMELEAASGVGASTISKIERGVSRPQAGTLHKLADALGVEVDELYPKAWPRLEVFKLPGLDAALKRHGMSRNELSFRAGMTPGEVLDYEIGAKKPSDETVDRLADALGVPRYELISPPEQVAAKHAEEELENKRATEKRLNMSAHEIREEQLKNPTQRRIAEAYEKNDAERRTERSRKDRPA